MKAMPTSNIKNMKNNPGLMIKSIFSLLKVVTQPVLFLKQEKIVP